MTFYNLGDILFYKSIYKSLYMESQAFYLGGRW